MKFNIASRFSSCMERRVRRKGTMSAYEAYELAERRAKEGRWRDSVFFYEEALRLQRIEYGRTDPRVARTLNDLGVAMSHLRGGDGDGGRDRHADALRAFREALVIQREVLPSDDRDIEITAANMTMLLDHMKRTLRQREERQFVDPGSAIV